MPGPPLPNLVHNFLLSALVMDHKVWLQSFFVRSTLTLRDHPYMASRSTPPSPLQEAQSLRLLQSNKLQNRQAVVQDHPYDNRSAMRTPSHLASEENNSAKKRNLSQVGNKNIQCGDNWLLRFLSAIHIRCITFSCYFIRSIKALCSYQLPLSFALCTTVFWLLLRFCVHSF